MVATDHVWGAVALIASGSNNFSGRISFDNHDSGDLRGALYGPAAEEVGGAYHLKSHYPMPASPI